jgi:hypothetical protein
METNPLYGRQDEMLDTFLLRPVSTQPTATPRVADLYSGGAITEAVQREGLDLVYRHDPGDQAMPDFDAIPDFEVLTATLPQDSLVEARERVIRFLRVRRPWVFVLVGGDDETLWRIQDWTDRLGYRINRVHAAIIGTLGRELPSDAEGESLVMRLVRASVE